MLGPVSVLIMDELSRLSSTLRATLEQLPTFRMIVEDELEQEKPQGVVALFVVQEARIADDLSRIIALRTRAPTLRVLVAFQALNGSDLRQLLEAGADAFVTRSASADEIRAALVSLARGGDSSGEASASSSGDKGESDLGLTRREAEVLRFLSAGFSNKEVARRLDLSVRTVETHRLNLRRKTQTGRLKDLISLARQLGLDPVLDARSDPAPHFVPSVSTSMQS